MGLDTTHDAWVGPCSAFNEWRNLIALAAGYKVEMHIEGVFYPEIDFSEDNIQGEWIEAPSDPLMVLIAHADNEGVIHPQHAAPLADRLEELLSKPAWVNPRFAIWKETTQRFIDGLRSAVAANEDLEFF